jgi:pimeloyl-ACP methyl ester carboxylesterase
MAIFHHHERPLHFLERGSGSPLLLIHGLGSSGVDWALQVRTLEARFHIIVPDLPGCGYSSALRDGCSIAALAASLWSLIDRLGIGRPNIVGYSLGGAVGLEMALQRPDCVTRLGLVNSLTSYRLDTLNKWLEARISVLLIRLFGMRLLGRLCATRMFPHPWQRSLRERAARSMRWRPRTPASLLYCPISRLPAPLNSHATSCGRRISSNLRAALPHDMQWALKDSDDRGLSADDSCRRDASRSKSLTLRVARSAPLERAVATIMASIWLMGLPADRREALISAYTRRV